MKTLFVMINSAVCSVLCCALCCAQTAGDLTFDFTPSTRYYANTVAGKKLKYDLTLSNFSNRTFQIMDIDVIFRNPAGQTIPELSMIYSNVDLRTMLNDRTFYIIDFDEVLNETYNFSYLHIPIPGAYDDIYTDTIHWRRDHQLPSDMMLLFLFPIEDVASNYSIGTIQVTVHGYFIGNPQLISKSLTIQPKVYKSRFNNILPLRKAPAGKHWFVLNSEGHDKGGTLDANAAGMIDNSNPSRYALDFMMMDAQSRLYKNQGLNNSDYYCWNQPVYAIDDGVVIAVEDDVADNASPDPLYLTDPFPSNSLSAALQTAQSQSNTSHALNVVMIDHGRKEIGYYGHLKYHSVTVQPGDRVTRGQLIARVGSSGTKFPHLHYHLMYDPDDYVVNNPPYGSGDDTWSRLPGGIPTLFHHCKYLKNGVYTYAQSAFIDDGAIVEPLTDTTAPVVSVLSPSTPKCPSSACTFVLKASEPDSYVTRMRISVYAQGIGWVVRNKNASYNQSDDTWRYTLDAAQMLPGKKVTLYYDARNISGVWSTRRSKAYIVNKPPVIASIPNYSVQTPQTVHVVVDAHDDDDPMIRLTVELNGYPGGFYQNANHLYFTPSSIGTFLITVNVFDNYDDVHESFTLTVRDGIDSPFLSLKAAPKR